MTDTAAPAPPPGIGVDIIALARVKDAIETTGAIFLDKVFTRAEQERSRAHAYPVACLAMNFAAKEAIFKSFGTSWSSGVRFTEIEISDGPNGEPLVRLSGGFAALAAARGVSRVSISLAYDGDYAIAMASLN